MAFPRREFILSGVALGLAGCVSDAAVSQSTKAKPATAYPIQSSDAFDAWLKSFRRRAASNGISQRTLDEAFRGAGFMPDVVKRDRTQIDFRRTTEEYLAIAASDARVKDGRAMLRRYGGKLAAIEGRFGVPAHVVTAVWGLESRYGTRRGDFPVISALATLSFDGRRRGFFEGQLMAALRILQNGDITPSRMTGSWAGAMGHTQFIPTTYQAYAVDFDGDGRRDIWSDDPTDALASAAHYLSRSGWQKGQPWGLEVTVPDGTGSGTRGVAAWASAGVRPARGGQLPNAGSGTLIRTEGPNILVFKNYRVFRRYNDSLKYAIGVGHLSDRIRGEGPFVAPFPPDANGMTQADRKKLQSRLAAKGYDIGDVDGVIGKKAEAAISAYQKRSGLAVTGKPSLALLQALG